MPYSKITIFHYIHRYVIWLKQNLLWILTVIIILSLLLWGKHADLLIPHRISSSITVGYTFKRESLFLAYISQKVLAQQGLKSSLQQIDSQEIYYGLDANIDFIIIPLTSYRHLGITTQTVKSMDFTQFYRLYSSYWLTGIIVGDPTEHDIVYADSPALTMVNHVLVPVYQSRIYTSSFGNALGFISGELSYTEIVRDLEENPTEPPQSIAMNWWEEHSDPKN